MPSWAKEEDKLPRPINAKAETAAIKPMFRQAYRRSRVLVPADAFYEWKVVAGKKQPFLIHNKTWLDPQLTDVSKIQTLIGPYPEQLMEAYPVSAKVNSPKNDTPDLTAELT